MIHILGDHNVAEVRVFENRVLRKISGLMMEEVAGGCIMRCFITCMLHHTLLG